MSDTRTDEAVLKYTRTDQIAIPPSGVETRIAIRKSDWARLKRRVAQCGQESLPSLHGWAFCLFGISGSAALALMPLWLAQGLPPWVVPLYLCLAISAFVLAAVLIRLERRLKKVRSSQVQELTTDMGEIETAFGDLG